MPLLAPAHGRLTPDVFVLGLPVNPYQPGYPLGEAPLRLLPASIPPPVSSPVSGDVDTTGVHDLSSQGLRDTPSTPARGKATKRRQVLCSPACVTSLPLAAPRVERDAVPRSSPEACLPPISVAGSPGGAVMWTRTIRWGSFCLHLVAPTRRRIGSPVMIPCYRV